MPRKNQSLILSELEGQVSEEMTYQAKLRNAVFNAVTESDVQEVVKGIVKRAKDGDQHAVKNLFDYVMGAGKSIHLSQHNHYEAEKPLPTEELDGTPGSPDRIKQLTARAKNGQQLFNGE